MSSGRRGGTHDNGGLRPLTEEERKEVEGALRLVRQEAKRLVARYPGTFRVEDVLGPGTIGFIAAKQRFDSGRGSPFEYYAKLRVRGAILDALRTESLSAAKKRELAMERAWVKQQLIEADCLPADRTFDEQDQAIVDRAFQRGATTALATLAGTTVPPIEEDVERREVFIELLVIFRRAFAAMHQDKREIFEAHFVERIPLTHLATVHGHSLSTISRRLQSTTDHLREVLKIHGFSRLPELVDFDDAQGQGPTSMMRPKASLGMADHAVPDEELDPPASSAR